MSYSHQLKIGLLTDIHYDGSAKAMNRLYESMKVLNAGGVDAMVVMGDLVDSSSELNAKRLLREVCALCDGFKGATHYMHGNHDLDHLSKAQFYNCLGRAGDPSRFHFGLGGMNSSASTGTFHSMVRHIIAEIFNGRNRSFRKKGSTGSEAGWPPRYIPL